MDAPAGVVAEVLRDDIDVGSTESRTREQGAPADEVLTLIVERLVEAVDPERLILFGSRAKSQARPQSDYDILIIKSEPDPARRRTGRLYRILWGIPAPVDLLWFTPEEIEEWSDVPQHVTAQAMRTGLVVYEVRPV